MTNDDLSMDGAMCKQPSKYGFPEVFWLLYEKG